jgi:type I restriction enzyme S subunit
MSFWKEIRMDEILESANTGLDAIKRAPIVDYDSGTKCLRIQDISQEKDFQNWGFCEVEPRNYDRFQLKKGDIIVARTGATVGVNRFFTNDLKAVFNNGLIRLRTDVSKCIPKYLFYNLRTSHYNSFIESISGGTSTQPNMQINALVSFEMLLPPLPEQTAIAEVLSSLDDKIDLLHRQNKTLEQLAETLFNEKIRVNSDKWREKPLSDLIETTIGGEWGKENPEGEFTKQVCCIRGTDIADLQVGLATRTPIRFVKEKKFENIQPLDGDLILEISGGTDDQSTGRTIYINDHNRSLFPYPIVFSNFCRLIRPIKKNYSYFLYLYIQYLYKKDEFFNLENGSSGIKNLDYKYLINDLKFLIPNDKKEIIKINTEVEIYFEKINKNKHQIRTLTQLRDTLLPKLMSGEVRVK